MLEPVTLNASNLIVSEGLAAAEGAGAVCATSVVAKSASTVEQARSFLEGFEFIRTIFGMGRVVASGSKSRDTGRFRMGSAGAFFNSTMIRAMDGRRYW